jgi:hypothetical protein
MLWQADGDIIVPDGSRVKGRNQIENFYSGVFAKGYGASRAIATVSGRWLIVASREMEPLLGSNTITLRGRRGHLDSSIN